MGAPTGRDLADRQRKSAIRATWLQCSAIVSSGIFSSEGVRSPLFQAAVVQFLICLNDLLQKAASDNVRVAFTDHVQVQERIADVTDLVRECRNAACHIGSTLSDAEFGRFRFGVVLGRTVAIKRGDDPIIESEFDDDIAVFYGNMRLYLQRHALRALKEVATALQVQTWSPT